MDTPISPKYQMALIKSVNDSIWEQYKTYKDVLFYIEKWHVTDHDWNNNWENFQIKTKDNGEIDLAKTLHNVDGSTLIKMAIDLGVETPDFIPTIPTFRNDIKADYQNASYAFEKAFKEIESHPDNAIALANSALESIIKEIFKDDRIVNKPKDGRTLYDLVSDLLKELQLYPGANIPTEIRTIGSSLLAASQSIEKLRSEKTHVHGKATGDYVVNDAIYAYFTLNSVITIGMFLKNYYRSKFPKPVIAKLGNDDDLPF